jgi:pimeloyl-ACP methyl ester carboxylesterase
MGAATVSEPPLSGPAGAVSRRRVTLTGVAALVAGCTPNTHLPAVGTGPVPAQDQVQEMAAGARRREAAILVHGAWHGGWAWDEIAARLRRAGWQVAAPTLPGLTPDHDRSLVPTLDDHVAAVLAEAERLGGAGIVLVGHSYGGMVATGAAARLGAARVRHVVYLDAALPRSGQSMITQNPATATPQAEAAAVAALGGLTRDGVWMEPLPPEVFGIPSSRPDLLEILRARLVAHPLPTWTERLAFDEAAVQAIARTYVWCNAPALEPSAFAVHARAVREGALPGRWRYRELATGHNAMMTEPDAVTEIITSA